MQNTPIEAFDWGRMLLDDLPLLFLLEVLFRTLITFTLVLISLRTAGKRGVRQLSVFELIIILTLGSAAGDVAFYEDVPILPIVMVFVGITLLYWLTTQLISFNDKAEQLLEGKPLVFVKEGRFNYDELKNMNIAQEELIMELRVNRCKHLGEIELAILETSGQVSIFRYGKEDVRPGMPTLPNLRNIMETTREEMFYSCAQCAFTRRYPSNTDFKCEVCGHDQCMKAVEDASLRDVSEVQEAR